MATAFQDTPDAFQENALAWQIENGSIPDDVYNWLQLKRDQKTVFLGQRLRIHSG